MSPEQARGKYAEPADLWALGAVLFDMMVRDYVKDRPILYMECLMMGMPPCRPGGPPLVGALRSLWPVSAPPSARRLCSSVCVRA